MAGLLEEYGRRTMLLGGNPYRAKAYIRAAENLALLTEPLETVVAEGRLREISGVGKAIADIIDKLSRCQRPVQACWPMKQRRRELASVGSDFSGEEDESAANPPRGTKVCPCSLCADRRKKS